MLAILLLAFGVQLYRLDARSFHGDELGSVAEAKQLGLNANSLPYSALLRLLLTQSSDEFWLRSLSAFAAVMAVAVTGVWAKHVGNKRMAFIAAALMATSPFLIAYGQQVRFYAVALLAAALSIWAFTSVLYDLRVTKVGLWVIASIAAVLCLLLNGVLVLSQIATWFSLSRWPNRRVKFVVVMAVLTLAAALLILPAARQIGFSALAAYVNADARYVGSRGFSLSQAAKIPLTLFFLTFGESVYPLTFTIVVPGLIIIGTAVLLGMRRLWGSRKIFVFVVLSGTMGLVLTYLVFDPLVPPSLQGAAPRYLIFLLPLFYLVVAAGAQDRTWLMAALLLMNGASLASYWYGDWAYTDDLINWREVTRRVEPYVTAQTLMLLDGRSRGQADYYFPANWPIADAGSYQSPARIADLQRFARLIVVSYDFHQESRAYATALLEAVGKDFHPSLGWSQYPLFVYVYDRNADGLSADAAIAAQPVVSLPPEIYGLEFQDVRLPLTLRLNETTWQSGSMFSLPSLTRQDSQMLRTACPAPAQHLWLFSNLTAGSALRVGEPVAELVVRGRQGESQLLPIRLAYETANWDGQCQPNACRPAYRWPKRLALLGSEAYPGSWQEFNAAIFAAEVDLSHAMDVCTIEVRRTTPQAVFHVWGLALER